MLDWPGNDRKMTSHSIFKLSFFERSLDLVRGFLFQSGVIWDVWPPGVIIWLKMWHLKLAGKRLKNDVTQQIKSKIF